MNVELPPPHEPVEESPEKLPDDKARIKVTDFLEEKVHELEENQNDLVHLLTCTNEAIFFPR